MYKIRTYNSISPIINNYLDERAFTISDSHDDYHGILVRSANLQETDFPPANLAIARAGAGVNNIPVDKCSDLGIVVFNTPGANANAVRELVICGLLLSGRRILEGAEWLISHKQAGEAGLEKLAEKAKSQFVGHELKGKKLGVVGLGAIGVLVANAARNGLDMDVLGYDPYLTADAALHLTRSVQRAASLEQVYRECDYISLHLPLNDKTKNMISEKELAMMKPGVVILNFARGGLIDIPSLLAALDSGQLGRYVTDFAADELVGRENVLCLPHLGASTPESEDNCAAMAASQMKNYLLNGNIHNSVNYPDCELPRNGSAARLCLLHKNVNNMINNVTACLSNQGLNIDTMINKSRGDLAYTIIDVGGVPDEKCLAAIAAIPEMIRVRLL